MAKSPVKIAIVQNNPQAGLANKQNNLASSLRYIEEAADSWANLVVFPELTSSGYMFETRSEAFEHGESIEDGASVRMWKEAARQRRIHIAAGLVEREGPAIYNTSVLIGPDGVIGKYRKTHLWGDEKLYFSPGNSGLPVFDTELGRIGMVICWDNWFPETLRILAVQGADIVCALNNFSNTPDMRIDDSGRCMASYLIMSHAHMNGIFVAAANRVGTERGETFIGCSLLAGPQGWPIVAAGAEDETMLLADIDLSQSRDGSVWGPYNDLYRDRRTDIYDAVLGYKNGYVWPR